MSTFIDTLNHVAEMWWPYVLHATWQSALVGGVLLAVVWLGRRWPAPLRYWLLLIALAKFAIPPMLSTPTGLFSWASPVIPHRPATSMVGELEPAALPSLEILKAPPSFQTAAVEDRDDSEAFLALAPMTSDSTLIPAALVSPRPSLNWRGWLLAAHVFGCAVVLIWMMSQLVRLSRATRRAQAVRDGDLHRRFVAVCERLGLHRKIRFLLSPDKTAPVAFGVFKPTVMVPSSVVDNLSPHEVDTVLGHELAHHRRRDTWVNWAQILLAALWWFNPVIWLLNRAIRRAREDCCDDLVLARDLTTTSAYCDTLLRAASEVPARMPVGAVLGFAERFHPLAGRLRRIMDETLRRSPGLSIVGMLLVVLLAGLLLPGLRSGLASQEETTPDAGSTEAAVSEEDTGSDDDGLGVEAGVNWEVDETPHGSIGGADVPSGTTEIQPAGLDTRIRGPMMAQDSPLDQIMTLLGAEAGLQFTLDAGASARVTFSLQDPSVHEVLDTILPGCGLDYLINRYGVVRIGHAGVIARAKQEPPSPPDESATPGAAVLDTRLQGPMMANQSPMDQILTLLTADLGVRFTLDPGIRAKVTFTLQNPSVREILDTILPGQGLDYLVTEHGTIRIGPAAVIAHAKQKPPSRIPEREPDYFDARVDGPLTGAESDLTEILILLASETGMNFTIDQGAGGKVTFNLMNPSVREVLDAILPGCGLDYVVTGHGVVRIAPAATITRLKYEPERLTTVVFNLERASVDDVQEPLAIARTEHGRIVFERESNRVIVTDTQDAIAKMSGILAKLESRATPSEERLITAVFRLRYLAADELTDELTRMKSKQGHVFFDRRTKSVVVSDTQAVVGRMAEIIEKLDVAPETTAAAKAVQLDAKILGPIHVPFHTLKEPLESVKSERGRFIFIEDSNQIAVFDTPDIIAEMEKILAELDVEAKARPTPTPRPLAQNYRIRNMMGSSAILIDYRLQARVVREGQKVDDPLGDFVVEEVDAKHRRVRVRLLSTGHERWITEWETERPSRRQRR